MSKNARYIMLIDDNPDDNFFHEREIKKNSLENIIIVKTSAVDALEYLKSCRENESPYPDLIFLDINMPGMNGWEFLQEYNKLDKELQSSAIIVMLTTSENPADKERAQKWNFVTDYITKPLTKNAMQDIADKFLK